MFGLLGSWLDKMLCALSGKITALVAVNAVVVVVRHQPPFGRF